jgi:hypothetical protein
MHTNLISSLFTVVAVVLMATNALAADLDFSLSSQCGASTERVHRRFANHGECHGLGDTDNEINIIDMAGQCHGT